MARLALDDRAGYMKACARMIELAEATEDRAAAQMTALTCVLDANTVPKWDVVIRLAARAAEGYDGDYRVHVAALSCGSIPRGAGRRGVRTQSMATSFGSGSSRACCVIRPVATTRPASILEQKFKMIDYMDQEMPRDPKSKIWSDWIYHVQCHALRKEAEGLLGRDELRKATPPG